MLTSVIGTCWAVENRSVFTRSKPSPPASDGNQPKVSLCSLLREPAARSRYWTVAVAGGIRYGTSKVSSFVVTAEKSKTVLFEVSVIGACMAQLTDRPVV